MHTRARRTERRPNPGPLALGNTLSLLLNEKPLLSRDPSPLMPRGPSLPSHQLRSLWHPLHFTRSLLWSWYFFHFLLPSFNSACPESIYCFKLDMSWPVLTYTLCFSGHDYFKWERCIDFLSYKWKTSLLASQLIKMPLHGRIKLCFVATYDKHHSSCLSHGYRDSLSIPGLWEYHSQQQQLISKLYKYYPFRLKRIIFPIVGMP